MAANAGNVAPAASASFAGKQFKCMVFGNLSRQPNCTMKDLALIFFGLMVRYLLLAPVNCTVFGYRGPIAGNHMSLVIIQSNEIFERMIQN